MRILVSALSCNPALGSEALVGFKYAEALARRHEVVVLASPPAEPPPLARLVSCNAGSCSFNEVGAPALLRFEARQWRAAGRLRRQRPFDLVHRITPSSLEYPTLLSHLNLPLVVGPVISGNPVPSAFEPFLRRPVSPPRHRKIHPARVTAGLCRRSVAALGRRQTHLEHAQLIFCGTRTAYQRIPEHLREKCEMITYAGVEHSRFTPTAERRSEGPLRVLFVGRIIPYKGVELLIRAIHVAARSCALQLRVVGGGDPVYLSFLQQLVQQLNISHLVEFCPAVQRFELPRMYQQADLFCLPSNETYGIALLEAMSCGCAVAVSDCNGPGEIVREGTGIKIRMEHPDQFIRDYAEAIMGLARNADLRMRLGAAARRHIVFHHDWERIGGRMLAVYDSLPERSPRQTAAGKA